MGGLLATGKNMENSAMRGLLNSAEMETQRNIANDNIDAQATAARKSRNGTIAGIGAYAAPSIAGALTPTAAATGLTAGGSSLGSLGLLSGTAGSTVGAGAGITVGLGYGGATAVGAGAAAGETAAAGTALTAAGGSSAVPVVGWIAAAGLAAYAAGSMLDWW